MADTFPFNTSRRSSRLSTIKIPKDQASLLQRPDSWINALESGHSRLGIINIPPSVLTTFTEFHRRRRLTRTRHQENVGGTATEAVVHNGTQSLQQASSPESRVLNVAGSSLPAPVTPQKNAVSTGNSERDEESSPEKFLTSWSVTSVAPSSPLAQTVQESPPTNSITPVASALSLANGRRSRNRSAEPPRSSIDEEEELEVAVPNVAKLAGEAVNRLPVRYAGSQPSALSSPRICSPPPCGQGDPDSTQRESAAAISQTTPAPTAGSVARRPDMPARRPRRMEAPSFSQIEPDQVYLNRHLSTSRPKAGEDSASSSLAENSLGMTPDLPRLSPEKPKRRLATNSIISDQEHPQKKRRISQHGPASMPPGEVFIPATPLLANRPTLGVGDVKPFRAFRLIYPEYRGRLSDFIRACVCLKFLQDRDLLSDFLYDDFIRAFTEGYVDYVGATDRPLPAHQWYNRIGGKPAYDEMIIRRSNLDDVFDAYPETTEEVANEVDTSMERLLKQNQPKDVPISQVDQSTQTDTPSSPTRPPRTFVRAASKNIVSSQLSSASTKLNSGYAPPPHIESHDRLVLQSSPPPKHRPSQREYSSPTSTPATIPASQLRAEVKSRRAETGSILDRRISQPIRTITASQMSDAQVTETPLRPAGGHRQVQDIVTPCSPLSPASRALRELLGESGKDASTPRPMPSSPELDIASKAPILGTLGERSPRPMATKMRSMTPHPPKPSLPAASSKASTGLTRGARHSLPPRMSGKATLKDALKTVADGTIQKPTVRRSLPASRGGSAPMSREEALRMHILRRKAEIAASSSPVPVRKK